MEAVRLGETLTPTYESTRNQNPEEERIILTAVNTLNFIEHYGFAKTNILVLQNNKL